MSDSDTSALRHPAGARELSGTDLHIGFHEIDTDADGLIDFREFVNWWSDD